MGDEYDSYYSVYNTDHESGYTEKSRLPREIITGPGKFQFSSLLGVKKIKSKGKIILFGSCSPILLEEIICARIVAEYLDFEKAKIGKCIETENSSFLFGTVISDYYEVCRNQQELFEFKTIRLFKKKIDVLNVRCQEEITEEFINLLAQLETVKSIVLHSKYFYHGDLPDKIQIV